MRLWKRVLVAAGAGTLALGLSVPAEAAPPEPAAEQPVQLQGRHGEAEQAAALASALGRVSLANVLRNPLHHTWSLDTCAYQFLDGNVMPPGNVESGGFCWDGADEDDPGWTPQGLTSTADASAQDTYGGHHYLAASWHNSDDSASRVSFVNMDGSGPVHGYEHVALVKAKGAGCEPVGIHAGGMAWYGHTLFVAGDRGLHVFDLRNLAYSSASKHCGSPGVEAVLPESGQYLPVESNKMGLDSMSIDREPARTPTLVVGDYYEKPVAHPDVARYRLDPDTGMLAENSGHRAVAEQTYHANVKNMQGVLAHGGYFYFSTSNGDEHGDLVTIPATGGKALHHCWSKTGENVAYRDGYLWSLTEMITKYVHVGHRIVFKTKPEHYQSGHSDCP